MNTKESKQVSTFNCEGYVLQVLHAGKTGLSWDFPVKPNNNVSTQSIQDILSNFDWTDTTE